MTSISCPQAFFASWIRSQKDSLLISVIGPFTFCISPSQYAFDVRCRTRADLLIKRARYSGEVFIHFTENSPLIGRAGDDLP